ncbi:MAG: FtsX-like permease family protein, partial [Thermofilaceae archaeon]
MVPLYYYATVFDRRGTGLAGSVPVKQLTFRLDAGERWALGVVQDGKQVLTAFDYASSLHTLVSGRYSIVSSREVRRLSGDLMLEYSGTHLAAAREALRELRYGDAYRNALAAWSYATRAYADETMPLYDESIKSAVTMVPFLAIAAYFLERLLLKGEGFRMIFNLILLEVIMFIFFALIHPAFWIVPSTLLSALGIGLLVLMGVVLWIFYREARDIASEVAAKFLGRHEVVSEKTAATLMAMSLSTENMRKRPLRTVLTILPLIVFSMALVSLASLSPYTAAVASPIREARAPYYGILVKRMFGVLNDALDYPSLEMLKAIVGNCGTVNPRIWYYPPSIIGMGPYGLLISGNSTARVTAVLGLTPSEASIILSKGIVEGFTEPFFSEDQLAIVLPATLASSLGVGVGDEVELQGIKLVVTGIISETTMGVVKDFDAGSLAPIDPLFYSQLNGFSVQLGGAVTPQPLSWSRLVIVPSGIARKLGGFVSSASVILDQSFPLQKAEELARRLAYSIMMTCYLGIKDGSVFAYTRFPTYAAVGWEMMVTPFILTALSIVVSLLGSVKERSRELFTYSSVGLSPNGAMLMFLTEFAVYGFLGATIGYFAGWASSKVFRISGVLPLEFVFNYASIAITLVMALVLLSTLVASAYPAYLASKIITPSLERRWKVARAPRGSIWELPLPFRVPTEQEVQALLLYIQEYYTGAGYEKRLFKVSAEPKVNLPEKRLTFNVRLYPYDTSTEQEVNLYFMKEKVGGWRAGVNLKLLKGLGNIWTGASQYAFLDDFRKQLLLWGTLSSAERARYFKMVEEQLSKNMMNSSNMSGEREPKS